MILQTPVDTTIVLVIGDIINQHPSRTYGFWVECHWKIVNIVSVFTIDFLALHLYTQFVDDAILVLLGEYSPVLVRRGPIVEFFSLFPLLQCTRCFCNVNKELI